jgi:hypothetical protein
MVARQKRPGAVLEIGEQVAMTLADRVVVVEVVRYHGKDVELQILGRRDDGPVSTTPK